MNNQRSSKFFYFLLLIFLLAMVINSQVSQIKIHSDQAAVIDKGVEYTAKIKKSDSVFALWRGVDNALLEVPPSIAVSEMNADDEASGGFLDSVLGTNNKEKDLSNYVAISVDKKVLNELVGDSGEGSVTAYYSDDYPDVYATQESLDRAAKQTKKGWIFMVIFIVIWALMLVSFMPMRTPVRSYNGNR